MKIKECIINIIKKIKVTDTMRKKTLFYFAEFMVFMLLCTIVSRGIYAGSLARVTTDNAKRMNINHSIDAEGKIEKGMESAVTVLAGIHVEQVYVNTGELVKENDPLLQLDREDLQEQMQAKQVELDKLELEIKDLKSNTQLAVDERNKKINRAKEDVSTATQTSDTSVNEARQALSEAQNNLTNLGSNEEYVKASLSYSSDIAAANQKVNQLKGELASLQSQLAATTATEDVASLTSQIADKNKAITEAQTVLESLKVAATNNASTEWKQKQQDLQAVVTAKQEVYDNAIQAKDSKLLDANRNLEDACVKENADSTLEIKQLDEKQKEEEITKYKELISKEGLISSDKAGMITKTAVVAGDLTPDGASLLIADMNENLQFTAMVTKAQQKLIAVGDSVTVQFTSGNQKFEDVSIDSIEADADDTEMYDVHVSIPPDKVTIGMSGTLKVEKQSDTFQTCVPLEALHSDGKQDYILVVVSKATILGEELYAERRNVNILDKNEKYAALDNGTITDEEKVIISSSKNISGGETVRLQEQ